MEFAAPWLCAAGTVLIFESLVFVLAMVFKNNGLADVAWGLGFVACAAVWVSWAEPSGPAPFWVMGAVSVWGIRLAAYLWWRNRGRPEDFRYAQWRKDWGRHWLWRSYLQVFVLQGLILLVNQLPLYAAMMFPRAGGPGWLFVLGFLVWLIGFLWEAIADTQLYLFKRNPANSGRVMRYGLWRFHRHPNYFGEMVLWWGFGLMALDGGGWWSLPGVLLINWLLSRVSGVPMLEAKYKNHPEYLQYIREVPALLPFGKRVF
jgi:steroid 5-alpha reductase family enzyme